MLITYTHLYISNLLPELLKLIVIPVVAKIFSFSETFISTLSILWDFLIFCN